MKRIIYKFYKWKFDYYQNKTKKYFFKMLRAQRNYEFILYSKKTKLSKADKKYMKYDVSSVYGLSCYADRDAFGGYKNEETVL